MGVHGNAFERVLTLLLGKENPGGSVFTEVLQTEGRHRTGSKESEDAGVDKFGTSLW